MKKIPDYDNNLIFDRHTYTCTCVCTCVHDVCVCTIPGLLRILGNYTHVCYVNTECVLHTPMALVCIFQFR